MPPLSLEFLKTGALSSLFISPEENMVRGRQMHTDVYQMSE